MAFPLQKSRSDTFPAADERIEQVARIGSVRRAISKRRIAR
jgi:hypothetical protein